RFPSVKRRSTLHINQIVFCYGQSKIVVRADWHSSNTIREPVKIDLDVFLLFLFFFLVLLFVAFRLIAFPRDRYFIALRRERILHVLSQCKRINLLTSIRGEIELSLADQRRKLARPHVVQIISVRVPSYVRRFEQIARHAMYLP